MTTHSTRCSLIFGLLAALLMQGCEPENETADSQPDQHSGDFKKLEHGVLVEPAQGQAKLVRLQVMEEGIVRVTALAHKNLSVVADSLAVVDEPGGNFTLASTTNGVLLKTSKMSAEVSLSDGKVLFMDSDGTIILTEQNSGEFGPVTQDPVTPDPDSYALRQQWNKGTDENYFGLGQHQNGQVNLRGENVSLTTHNLSISIPFVVSTNNYGVLWDNASITQYGDVEPAKPFSEDFVLYDANGEKGALTAKYYDGEKLLLTKAESNINYQFLANNSDREVPFPKDLGDVTQPRVVWEGFIEAKTSGLHKFRMYNSGYASLSVGGKTLLERWRMNWNPWYHNTEVTLTQGVKTPINIDWDSQGGYFRLLHSDPLPDEQQYSLSFASETGKSIDYYVVVGEDYDEIIGGYRQLTGKSVMLPKWAYGFWQSRERYTNQDELIDVVKEYRQRKIPLDNIVLDWSYWPQDAWGSHDFDKQHFPDPKKMVDQVHDLNTNIMISVWPKFYPTTKNYKELDAKGYMLSKNVEQEANRDWIGEGYLNGFYDPYPQESKDIFWRQLYEKINVFGFDAWWLDASEPDMHSNLSYLKRKEIMSPQSVGSGAEYFNSYALANAEGVYQGERRDDGDKRSFILTRSGFAGIQRTGSAIWSGDTVPRWSNLKEQIAAGIGTSLAGMPNWTMDIGGFTPEDHFRQGPKGFVGHYSGMAEKWQKPWQELNLRWFQFGAFVPLFRSHGQNPYREIFNVADEGSDVYNAMVYYTKLRYRLMPYIYSQAGNMFHRDGTLMRGLVMDFPDDSTAINLNDQYMFGPAFLVAPVTEPGVTSRNVYLPKGTAWYDFYTGKKYTGGETIEAAAPLKTMPLFVKAGSIVPTGVDIQYVYDKPDAPYTLNVYTGADGEFSIYEDDGKTYHYEQGGFSFIPVTYDDAAKTLVMGERQGQFEGMTKERVIHVRWIDGASANAANFDTEPDQTFTYTGKGIRLKRK